MSNLQTRIDKLERASCSSYGSIVVNILGTDYVTVDGVDIPRGEYEPDPVAIVIDLTEGLSPRG